MSVHLEGTTFIQNSNTYVGNKLKIDWKDVKYVRIQISCKNT